MVSIATDRLTKIFDDGTVAVNEITMQVAAGEFVAFLGPTGCGKSTILRLVAGLEQPTRGHVLIDGQVADGIPVRDRRVAMVLQDYALYPHLTVAQNIEFPLRLTQDSPAAKNARVAEVAEQLGITHLLRRMPAQLSGGQRQRVAMARAIVREPHAFLLDEPLSNLDAGLRAEMRSEIAALARRLAVTTLYVTHDQVEAMTMADRVAVLRRGALQQIGPPAQVYGDPSTLFVAAFLGTPRTNLFQGAIYASGDTAVVDLGGQVIEVPEGDRRIRSLARWHTRRVTVGLRAEALSPVPAERPAGPVLRGTVRLVENLGHEALVHVDTGAVPTSAAQSHLEHPEPNQHLAQLLAEDPPVSGPLRQTLTRMIPHPPRPEPPPATARTPYGFYPVYDPELPEETAGADLVIRLPAPALPRPGEPLTLAVDLDQLLLFDHAGDRIRLD